MGEFPDGTVDRRYAGLQLLESNPKENTVELKREAVQHEDNTSHARTHESQPRMNQQKQVGPRAGGEPSLTSLVSPATEENNTASAGAGGELTLTSPKDCRLQHLCDRTLDNICP